MEKPPNVTSAESEYTWLYTLWGVLGYEAGTVWLCQAQGGGPPSCPECFGSTQNFRPLKPLPLGDGLGCSEGHRFAAGPKAQVRGTPG